MRCACNVAGLNATALPNRSAARHVGTVSLAFSLLVFLAFIYCLSLCRVYVPPYMRLKTLLKNIKKTSFQHSNQFNLEKGTFKERDVK